MMSKFSLWFLLTLAVAGCGVQSIPQSENSVDAAAAEVTNQYKRRADLIPNLVKLVDGMGEIDLSPFDPGKVELMVDPSMTMLKLHAPLKIEVKPAEPVEIVWAVANQQAVGQDLELTFKALDEHGNVCLHYSDEFTLQVRGTTSKDIKISTVDDRLLYIYGDLAGKFSFARLSRRKYQNSFKPKPLRAEI